MRISKTIPITLFTILALGSCDSPQREPEVSSAEKEKIEKIVHDYLIEHPEVLVKASQQLQRKNQEKQLALVKQTISDNAEELIGSDSPVIGNPQGGVVLVKFLDYKCGHCKRMEKPVSELVEENPNLKVVVKALPIFGEESATAARAALASSKQGKFAEMHHALLSDQENLTEERVFELAEQNGLDVKKLKKDMKDDSVEKEINQAYELAMKLSLQGTPFFIVMENSPEGKESAMVIPGAAQKAQLQMLIDKVQE